MYYIQIKIKVYIFYTHISICLSVEEIITDDVDMNIESMNSSCQHTNI